MKLGCWLVGLYQGSSARTYPVMGNPYISPIYPYNTWVFMGYYPQESLYKPYKYHGYTVRGTSNCPLIIQHTPKKREFSVIQPSFELWHHFLDQI